MKAADESCAQDLFLEFTFEDLADARPPEEHGVYVIRVRKRGLPPGEIIKTLAHQTEGLQGNPAPDHVPDMVSRIGNIGECPVICIGSAGTGPERPQTLAERHRDLTARHHPARPALRALLASGWELDFGWLACDCPGELEAWLKDKYQKRRWGDLPALCGDEANLPDRKNFV